MGRIAFLLPLAAATTYLLGEQGARLGPFVIPELSVRWVWLVLAVVFLLRAKKGDDGNLGMPSALATLAILVGLVAVSEFRSRALAPPLGIDVTIDDEHFLTYVRTTEFEVLTVFQVVRIVAIVCFPAYFD